MNGVGWHRTRTRQAGARALGLVRFALQALISVFQGLRPAGWLPPALACLGLSLGLLFSGPAWAAGTSVKLECNSVRIGPEDDLQVRVSASGTYDEVSELASEGFEFRQAGHQTQVNIIGAQMARVETWLYVGTPRQPGKFTVGPVTLRADGQDVATSNTLTIEVVGQQVAEPPGQNAGIATDLHTYAGQPFFVRPVLSTSTPYAGQPFVMTYELYWSRQVQVGGIRETQTPRWGNLDVEDLLGKTHPEQEPTQVQGKPYARQVTHRVVLTAAAPGKVRLEGPAYRIEAGDLFETKVRKIQAIPLEIEVLPVPTEGRPTTFVEGNVGALQLLGTLTRPGHGPLTDVQTGERLLLDLRVVGSGNLLNLPTPQLAPVPGMSLEPLPSRTDDGVQRTASGLQGQRSWQFVVSFDRPGKVTIPAVNFTAFDPNSKQFNTTAAGPFDVGVQGQLLAPAAPVQPQPIETSGNTSPKAASAADKLRPIAPLARLAGEKGAQWLERPWFRALLVLPWLLALALLARSGWLQFRRRHAPRKRLEQALESAKTALDQAVAAGPGEGYARVRQVAADYLQLTTGIRAGGKTESALVVELTAVGVAQSDAEQLGVELQHCDFARFAPGGDREADLQKTAARLLTVLARMDAARRPLQGKSSVAALGLLIVLGTTWVSLPSHAATLDTAFAQANQSYLHGDFAQAKLQYEQLLAHQLESAAVHYNLANTLVKLGQPGRAIGHYVRALHTGADADWQADAQANLEAVRSELADRARHNHAIMHVFDEAPEIDEALATAAPQGLLVVLALLSGIIGLAGLAMRILWRRGMGTWLGLGGTVVQVLAIAWLAQVQWVHGHVRHAVVIQEDASLGACQGVAEPIGLPEGLVLRQLAELPDGRVEVRLPNGRQGCLDPTTLDQLSD